MKLRNLALVITSCILIQCGSDTPSGEDELEVHEASFKVPGKELPFYGPLDIAGGDTLFYQVPKFYLTDHNGEGIGYSSFEKKIMLVDFFFTTCSTICPIMTNEMSALQGKLQQENLMGPVMFLSVTIDPETDTPEQLKGYAKEKGADLDYWKFATGDIDYIDKLSKEGFFLAIDRDVAYQDGIIHSSQLILVDQNRHVRGAYDGIDSDEMARLFTDIKLLNDE